MDDQWWEDRATRYAWMVPWRFLRQGDRWFLGGYSNVAANVVDRHLETAADRPVLVDGRGGRHTTLTYRDLYWQSAKLARWWSDAGIRAGDRILIAGAASLGHYLAWLACARLGAVVVRHRAVTAGNLGPVAVQTESRWLVASGDDLAQWRQALDRPGAPASVMVADRVPGGMRAIAVADAAQAADGVLDPQAVEASAITVLMYGDDEVPYAYAGMGGLMGWRESLTDLLNLSQHDIVGITSEYGGLHDLLPLTMAVQAAGAAAVWRGPGEAHHGVTKIICASSVPLEGQPAVPTLMLGWERVTASRTPQRVLRARADMERGQYRPGTEAVGSSQAEPSGDRSRVSRAQEGWRDMAPPPWTAGLLSLSGVRELVVTTDRNGSAWCWLRVDDDFDEGPLQILQMSREESPIPAGAHVTALTDFPETVEGRVSTETMAAVSDGAARISLKGLRNPQCVEAMVRKVSKMR